MDRTEPNCPQPRHHTVIIVGGGPAGLPVAAVLAGGWWPYYRPAAAVERRAPGVAARLRTWDGTLLALDFARMAAAGLPPVDFFNLLHHPTERYLGDGEMGLEFRRGRRVDSLLLSRTPVGGLWNDVPRNLLTLSPGHWMEFAFYPLAQWAREAGHTVHPEALIVKRDLLAYYHSIPARFDLSSAIRTGVSVRRIEPHPRGFLLAAVDVVSGRESRYTCRYVVYAAGQRCALRRLGIPGEDLPLVTHRYDRPETFPGDRVLVVGGGRSADWAATELHDDGRHVCYVMRQSRENHWRLINDSRPRLPYYARIAEIMEGASPRLEASYETRVEAIEPDGSVTLRRGDTRRRVRVDRVLLEIGGEVDYGLFQGFPPLTLREKWDRYRFQCHQVVTHAHNYESIDIPRMYPGGYLAAGLNNVVIAMHGTTYAIAADILQREGVVPRTGGPF